MATHDGFSWAEKSPLERTVLAGAYGTPQLRAEERRHYLGEFKERVIASLTKEQVAQPEVAPNVAKAVADPAAKALIMHGDVAIEATLKYRRLAREQGLPAVIRSDPSFQGEIGLVVVSGK